MKILRNSIPMFVFALLSVTVTAHAQDPPPLPPLLQAAAQGNLDTIKKLLATGTDIQSVDSKGWTALHHAASLNQDAVCALLLDSGADLEWRSSDGRTPLNTTAETGAIKSAKVLLERNAQINELFLGNMTSFNMAVHKRHFDLAKLLIERGANVAIPNRAGIAPMDVVFERGYLEIFMPMFDALHPDPKTRMASLRFYLERAIGLDDPKMFHAILDGNLELAPIYGPDAEPFFKAAGSGSQKILDEYLLKGRLLTEILPESQWTLLHLFARGNNVAGMTATLESGVPVDATDPRLWTPLHVAAYLGNLEAAKLLLQSGANIEARDESNATPLHLAAEQGNLETVQYLLSLGASPAALNHAGKTPLDLALRQDHATMRSVFPLGTETIGASDSNFRGKLYELRQAVLNRESETVKSVLDKANVDIDAHDEFGMSLLHYAADIGNVEILESLIGAGASVNTNNEKSGWSPLMHAVSSGHTNASKVLMMAGANVNTQDAIGSTPLHLAYFFDNADLISALGVAGARTDLRNHEGDLPEELAGHVANSIVNDAGRIPPK